MMFATSSKGYLMRPDRITRTSVIEPFNLEMDPVQVARAQLDRWTKIAYGFPVTPGVQSATMSGALGAMPNIVSAGPHVVLPRTRTHGQPNNVVDQPPNALIVAQALSRLSASVQLGLVRRLAFAFAQKGHGRTEGVLKAVLQTLPVQDGNSRGRVASLFAQLPQHHLAAVASAIGQLGTGPGHQTGVGWVR